MSGREAEARRILAACLWDEEAWDAERLVDCIEWAYLVLGGDLSSTANVARLQAEVQAATERTAQADRLSADLIEAMADAWRDLCLVVCDVAYADEARQTLEAALPSLASVGETE